MLVLAWAGHIGRLPYCWAAQGLISATLARTSRVRETPYVPIRVSSPILVGRESELSILVDAYEAATDRRPQIVIIEGDAGVGKSRLLTEFLGHVRARGGLPLVGRCADVEGGLPFGPIVEALRDLISASGVEDLPADTRLLGVMLPELGTEASEVSQTALFHAIGRVLAGADRPVVLVMEDGHWSDVSTREVTKFLADRFVDDPIAMVLSVRSDEADPPAGLLAWLGELKRSPRVTVISLQPLSREDMTRQIAEITGTHPSDQLVDTIYKRSQGNPFFVEELLVAGVDASPMSLPSLAELFRGRVDALGGDVHEVLRAVAVADRGVSSDGLAEILGDKVASLGDTLRTAVGRHLLVRDHDGRYSFRHALLRDLFYEELTSQEQRGYHAAFAAALASSMTDPDAGTLAQIAYHWDEAGDEHEAWAASLAAGRAAQRSLAYAEAARHLRDAAELGIALGLTDPPADLLYEGAAKAAASAGDWDQSAELLERAVKLVDRSADPERAAHLIEALAWCRWWALGISALSLIEDALALVPAEPATSLRARILRNYALQLEVFGEFERVGELNRQAVEVARAAGDLLEEGKSLVQAGTTLTPTMSRDLRPALAGFELIKRHGTADDVLSASVRLGNALLFVSDLQRLWSVIEEAIDLADGLHLHHSEPGLYLLASDAIFYLGKWEEAERLERLVGGKSATPRLEAVRMVAVSFVPIAQGRFENVGAIIDVLERFVRDGAPVEDIGGSMWPVLLFYLWSGDIDSGWAEVRRALDLIENHPYVPNAPDLLLVALEIGATRFSSGRAEAGDEEILERCIQQARECSPDEADRFGVAVLEWSEAEYARAHERRDSSLWLRIADAWADIGVPWFEAWTRWRAAEAMLLTGPSRADAGENLTRAWTIARHLGAAPLLAEIEALARRARLILQQTEHDAAAPSSDRRRSPIDRFGLTERELEVLRLVAEGRSNPEIAAELFISPKTASAHVSHILEKLGVARRVEAATMAHAMGVASAALDDAT